MSKPAPPTKVTLRVPATTANLGAAFDVMGMALSLWMELTVERADAFEMTIRGAGAGEVAADSTNMVVQSCELAFARAGVTPAPPLRYTVVSDIPFGCGCGSSSAAAVAGFVAGMTLAGFTLTASSAQEALLQIIADLEGHPDNAAPAIYGGVRLGFKDPVSGGVRTHRVPCPAGLSVVLFSPTQKMKASTHATRGLIPTELPLGDAVHNMSRTAILVLALSTGNTAALRDAMDDRIHQPARARVLFPHFEPCCAAAMAAGACFAFLSGAGPTICAFVDGRNADPLTVPVEERRAEAVARAMVEAAASAGIAGRAIITQPSDVGVHFVGATAVSESVSYLLH